MFDLGVWKFWVELHLGRLLFRVLYQTLAWTHVYIEKRASGRAAMYLVRGTGK